MAWGKMRPAEVSPLGAQVALGPYEADVVPAPGHCHDQVVFHVASEGWLFSGDAFIHERVKIFRRDEDFAASLVTLAHLVTLDFDTLFCAHRPRFTGGKAALQQKLEWLRHLEGEVKRLHAQGLSVREMARRLDLVLSRPVARSFAWLTVGDATPENVVRSILHGRAGGGVRGGIGRTALGAGFAPVVAHRPGGVEAVASGGAAVREDGRRGAPEGVLVAETEAQRRRRYSTRPAARARFTPLLAGTFMSPMVVTTRACAPVFSPVAGYSMGRFCRLVA
jgi:hypothetical protein